MGLVCCGRYKNSWVFFVGRSLFKWDGRCKNYPRHATCAHNSFAKCRKCCALIVQKCRLFWAVNHQSIWKVFSIFFIREGKGTNLEVHFIGQFSSFFFTLWCSSITWLRHRLYLCWLVISPIFCCPEDMSNRKKTQKFCFSQVVGFDVRIPNM